MMIITVNEDYPAWSIGALIDQPASELWARNELAKDGVADLDGSTIAVAAAGMPLLMGIHALMYKLLKE